MRSEQYGNVIEFPGPRQSPGEIADEAYALREELRLARLARQRARSIDEQLAAMREHLDVMERTVDLLEGGDA